MKTLTSLAMFTSLVFFCFAVPQSSSRNSTRGLGAHYQSAKDRHPELRRSLKSLQRSREDLMKSSHDYDGHRTKAVQAIDTAIDEVKQALALAG